MSDGFSSSPVIPIASASVPYSAGLNARTRYRVSTAVNKAVLIWVASPNMAFLLIVSPRWGDSPLGASGFISWQLPVRAQPLHRVGAAAAPRPRTAVGPADPADLRESNVARQDRPAYYPLSSDESSGYAGSASGQGVRVLDRPP